MTTVAAFVPNPEDAFHKNSTTDNVAMWRGTAAGGRTSLRASNLSIINNWFEIRAWLTG